VSSLFAVENLYLARSHLISVVPIPLVRVGSLVLLEDEEEEILE
jgi:hypothetical protein